MKATERTYKSFARPYLPIGSELENLPKTERIPKAQRDWR